MPIYFAHGLEEGCSGKRRVKDGCKNFRFNNWKERGVTYPDAKDQRYRRSTENIQMPTGFLKRDAETVGCKGLEWKQGVRARDTYLGWIRSDH